jgi:hypothetical protein
LKADSCRPRREYLATQRPIRCRLVRGVRVHYARWLDDNDLSCAHRPHLAANSARLSCDHSFHGIEPRRRLEENRGAFAASWHGSRADYRLPAARTTREHERPVVWAQSGSTPQSSTRAPGSSGRRTIACIGSARVTTPRYGQPFRGFRLFSLGAHRRSNLLFEALQLLTLWTWGFIWSGGWPFPSS